MLVPKGNSTDWEFAEQAFGYLRQGYGPDATFALGQIEAVRAALTPGSRTLLIQPTGWGKSVVYCIATAINLESKRGLTLVISPLISLMRNQEEFASKFGLNAVALHSENPDTAKDQSAQIHRNSPDILLISPEKLANRIFLAKDFPAILDKTQLFVIDEAHCITEWGHDFRPDFQRIQQLLSQLKPSTAVLAVTATADEKTEQVLRKWLGGSVVVQRGPMSRRNIRIRVIELPTLAERYAFLAKYVPRLEGTGIVYALTIHDAERCAEFLRKQGVDAHAYSAQESPENRADLETRFLRNEIKVLVATTALGMGFDKPDIAFVFHLQRPTNIMSYYQQIGRAGRAGQTAFAVLLTGEGDQEIAENFARHALPPASGFRALLENLQLGETNFTQLGMRTNLSANEIEQAIALLDVQGAIRWEGNQPKLLQTDFALADLTAKNAESKHLKDSELMAQFVSTDSCRMVFLANALGDSQAEPCGVCDNCRQTSLLSTDKALLDVAMEFVDHDVQIIEPKELWPVGLFPNSDLHIPRYEQCEPGISLSQFGVGDFGEAVNRAKYFDSPFPDRHLERAKQEIITRNLRPDWITWVPSKRHPEFVNSLAENLAKLLNIPAIESLEVVTEFPPQKQIRHPALQARNASEAFAPRYGAMLPGKCLLIDDILHSGWTIAACGRILRRAGAEAVIPLAFARARRNSAASQVT